MATIDSLVVEVRTDADPAAGTDDQVFFDIGTRQWRLDRVGHRDFRPGATDTFDLELNSALDTADIRRIGLSKLGWNGWRPTRITVTVNGEVLYRGAIGIWLDQGSDSHQTAGVMWQAADFPRRFPDRAVTVRDIVVATRTAAGGAAGTDDRVFFTVGTREWQLDDRTRDDREPGDLETYVIRDIENLRMDGIREMGLRKTGRDGWRPEEIRVWVNDVHQVAGPLYEGTVSHWLDGGPGAQLRHGLTWTAPDYPQPVPISDEPDAPVTALRLEVRTGTRRNASTNDQVYLDVGTREWLLDNPAKNDFESGSTDVFELEPHAGMQRSDIRRLTLRKTGTNGWQPRAVKLFVNADTTPVFDGDADLFLDSGDDASQKYGLRWTARGFDLEVPVACHLVVGTVDDTIRPGSSATASSALFDNFNTAAYRTRRGSANAIWTQARVRFRVVSFEEVAVADADAQMMPDSTDGFVTMRAVAEDNNVADVVNAYFVRATGTGSNWQVGGDDPAVWVQDTRGGLTVNTGANFERVAVSLAHELGHFLGLPHSCDNAVNDPCTTAEQVDLMMGDGTNQTSVQLSTAEITTAYAGARALAE
ncbi:hypothetical protein [Nocardioides euryhalodurans]|uniref:Uncharacterized protein n=1 Tax=Nocardioides euryhalodurans TaxID=2518370 RepID=A0A4P7GJ55_9ACTN|nr:hypothetical protein [Nocardioides euryhalodurans]QBR91995.1 hypothetical protein EXE57_06665 [Nocardioides euryhalodurans]